MSYSQVCVYIFVCFPSVLISLLELICYKPLDFQLAIKNIWKNMIIFKIVSNLMAVPRAGYKLYIFNFFCVCK